MNDVLAINDLFELVLRGTATSSPIANRFYWLGESASSEASTLADAFIAEVAPDIAAILHTSATLTEVSVRNLTNLADIDLQTISLPGLRTGDVLREFYAVALELDPASPLVRVGRKAFSPISEADVQGVGRTAAFATEMQPLELALIGSIDDGAGSSFSHVMYSPANTRHATDIITSVSSALFKRLSTQNTRKPY